MVHDDLGALAQAGHKLSIFEIVLENATCSTADENRPLYITIRTHTHTYIYIYIYRTNFSEMYT